MEHLAANELTDRLLAPGVLRHVILGVGFLLVLVALVTLMVTRWGQARPLYKCVLLSLFAHMMLVSYAYFTTDLFERPIGLPREVTRVTIVSGEELQERSPQPSELPLWERHPTEASVMPQELALAREIVAAESSPQRTLDVDIASVAMGMPSEIATATEFQARGDQPRPNKSLHTQTTGAAAPQIEIPQAERRAEATPAGPPADAAGRPSPRFGEVAPPRRTSVSPIPNELASAATEVQRLADIPLRTDPADALASTRDLTRAAIDQTLPGIGTPSRSAAPPGQALPIPSADPSSPGGPVEEGRPTRAAAEGDQPRASSGEATAHRSAETGEVRTASPLRRADGKALPSAYELRAQLDRGEIARRHGGNARTEAAVEAALAWLAAHQSAEGHWDAARFGAGRETRVLGHDRGGAGARADTGVTALALLAFMGAGHTHYEGDYRKSVQHGLEYLLRSQARDGSMAGGSDTFAQMYCHGMATLAIAEAYAITGDERLKWWVERAVAYTVASQHSTDGGWRYRPGDEGDTSQFGWQVMALKAAENGGIEIPEATRRGVSRFLARVSSGRHGGLAAYRPGEEVSPAMTAEAFACRYFLGISKDNPAVDEAASYLGARLPGRGKLNLYYWYYATLAMHQLQDERWDRWNEALQTRLLASQRKDGSLAGTWDPDAAVWGGYGGRVYTTAMGALCLESYYRFSLARETVRE